MPQLVSNSKDFETVLIECTYGFDSSKDTAEARVRDWLWQSRDNRVIGKDTEDVYKDPIDVSEGIDSIIEQISEFSDKVDKLCIAYYLISTTDTPIDKLHLSVHTNEPAVNNDNAEVNMFLDNVSVLWLSYTENVYNEQIRQLMPIIGKEVMDSIMELAPMALRNEQVGPLEKQLRARGVTDRPDWNNAYERIKIIKRDYREKLRSKTLSVFSESGLEKLVSYDQYLDRVAKLKDAIKHNIEMLGGVPDAEII